MSGTGAPTDKITWLWKQVEHAREENSPERARESLERLLADPSVRGTSDEDLAVMGLSQLDLDSGRHREVAERLSGFEWHGVPSPAGLLLAADIFLKLGWFEQSREALEDYMKVIPEDLDARRKLGLVLLMLNRDEEAQRHLLATARREKNIVPETLTYLAMLEAKTGRLEESLQLLLQARDLAPSDERIEHTLLRIEALRVSLKRKALQQDELPMEDIVAGMVSGMLELHGYAPDRARAAVDVWNRFCTVETPKGRKPAIWAAALEYAVTRSGPHFTQEQLALEYSVSVTQLREHYQAIMDVVDIDEGSGDDLLAETERAGSSLSGLLRREEMVEVISQATGMLSEFEGPGDLCAWVFDRVPPRNEAELREMEDFLGMVWTRHRN